MYIEKVPNRNSAPATLLRKSWRENGKVRKTTIANLSDWEEETVDALQKILRGAVAVFPNQLFSINKSLPHGHVEAVLGTIRNIGLDNIIGSKPSRERDLVIAMIVNQILTPDSKLACVNNWNSSTLAKELGISSDLADHQGEENELYNAMDWLYERRERIENKLAKKHLSEEAHALYDVSSSYYEGSHCSLAQYGYNRDGKKGKKIIVYGVLTNQQGCPVAVEVYPGNKNDSKTVPDQVEKLRHRFGLKKIVLIGDRGMLTQTQIDDFGQHPGIGWISALNYSAIRSLFVQQSLQLSLFDKVNIAEISSPDYPGERLVACYNKLTAERRAHRREDLLKATEANLDKIKSQVIKRRKKIMDKAAIGLKAGKVLGKHKMEKHFNVEIQDGKFDYSRNTDSIEKENILDGIYIVRTSEPVEKLSKEEVVRSYKDLSKVEQLFRTLKGVQVMIRPVRHRLEERVKAHIFICLLAYYVEWHMKKALAPLLFVDEEVQEKRKTRDAVAPVEPSLSAKKKKFSKVNEDGFSVQSFGCLLKHLAARTWNECHFNYKEGTKPSIVCQYSEMTPLQRKAFELLKIRTQ